MIHAYSKDLLNDSQTAMGYMLDHAVYYMGFKLSEFYEIFLVSDISKRIEKGDPFIICGRSGTELCYDIFEASGIQFSRKSRLESLGKSPEFWAGWALAYYQWYCGRDFATINGEVSIERVLGMYMPYHEMDILQFADRMDEIRRSARLMTYLKLYRKRMGMSQKQVSEASGVPLRTLQQYEQGQKSINNAKAEYVLSLSRVLGCKPEELLEG